MRSLISFGIFIGMQMLAHNRVLEISSPMAEQIEASARMPVVYFYHEPSVGGYAYFDVPKRTEPATFHRRMGEVLVKALRQKGIHSEMLDAKGWLTICNERRRCVVVDICQYPVEALYAGQDDGSPIEEWLDAGGIMIYSGDWPFHYFVKADGSLSAEGAGQSGDDDIFDADLVKDGFVGIHTRPTDAGRRWLPSLRVDVTLRPFDADAVKRHCPWFESYAIGERKGEDGVVRVAADAIAFRMPNGKGMFAAFHLRRGRHTDTNQLVFEFVTNRLPALLRGDDAK